LRDRDEEWDEVLLASGTLSGRQDFSTC